MRLSILDSGHSFGTKLLFSFIRLVSRQPVLDVIKLVKYRADFYGAPMAAVTHEAMRGPSSWSVGDRELMAAVIAQSNSSTFCTQAHSAVARRAYKNEAKVAAVLSNLDTAEIDERLRETLRMLRKLAHAEQLDPEDLRIVLNAGVTREQITDALAVSFSFNIIARLAEAFAFAVPSRDAMDSGARFLLARGYR